MIDEILHDLYCIKVPLPRNPLKYTNSYVIKGDGRFLVIDTGINVNECMLALETGLKKLSVNLERTDFFVTHLHHDHLGLVSTLATANSRVYFNQVEADILTGPDGDSRWARLMEFYMANGFPEEYCSSWKANRPASIFGPRLAVPYTILPDGGELRAGDYKFTCIQTPGHSPCHTCLFEKEKKILVSGDHILFDITPNITFWPELDNSLKSYMQNLHKVSSLDVDLVLPGHRKWQGHLAKRVTALIEHHSDRLSEAMTAVADGEKTAYEVAPYIKWDLSYKTWGKFPLAQKYFALGETIAHLEYLAAENKIRKRTVKRLTKYYPC